MVIIMLSSDWLNIAMTLDDVWFVASDVRLVAKSKRISHLKRDQC